MTVLSIVILGSISLYLLLSKWNKSLDLPQWMLPTAYLLKCAIGVIFLHMYIINVPDAHLKNDAGTFLHEGKILNDVFYTAPEAYFTFLTGIGENDSIVEHHMMETSHWSSGDQAFLNDNKNVIRIHSLLLFFSQGSPYVHLFIFCLLGLIGISLIYRWASCYSSLSRPFIFWALMLVPNILFWSSSILKEPFMLMGIGGFLAFATPSFTRKQRITWGVLGILFLLGYKPYILLALLPALLIYQLYPRFKRYRTAWSLGVLLGLGVIGIFSLPSLTQKVVHQLARKQFDFINVGQGGLHACNGPNFYYFRPDQLSALAIEEDSVQLLQPIDACMVHHGSLEEPSPIHLIPSAEKWKIHFKNESANSFIDIPKIRTLPDLLYAAPSAIVNVFFRPFPTDPSGALKPIVIVETILLWGFLIIAIFRRKTLSVNDQRILVSAIIFCIVLALMIGWITPVIGALVRYRIPIQLALLLMAFILLKQNAFTLKKHE